MYWYILAFNGHNDIEHIVELAQLFLDARESGTTLILYRKRRQSQDEPIIYYIGGGQESVEPFARHFNGVECLPPRPGSVELFGKEPVSLHDAA
jgi:hypothetical protein